MEMTSDDDKYVTGTIQYSLILQERSQIIDTKPTIPTVGGVYNERVVVLWRFNSKRSLAPGCSWIITQCGQITVISSTSIAMKSTACLSICNLAMPAKSDEVKMERWRYEISVLRVAKKLRAGLLCHTLKRTTILITGYAAVIGRLPG